MKTTLPLIKHTGLALICLVFVTGLIAQVPEAIKYQVEVRDNVGDLVINQPLGVRISLLQNGCTGVSTYTETHQITTSQFGLLSLSVGNGTVESGVFSTISWWENDYFIKVEIDENNGNNRGA